MKIRRKLFFALGVAFLMVATFVPAESLDSEADVPEDVSWLESLSEEDKKVSLVDNGNSTYIMSIPFLEDRFGYSPHAPDPEDPTKGILGITLSEIHSYYGSNGNNKIIEPDGSEIADGPIVTNGVDRGIEFSVAFSNRYLETGVEDIFTYGITTGGTWFLQNTSNTDAHFKDTSDTANGQYLGHLLTEYSKVGNYQGSNLFPYAVGDFVEDPEGMETEEIAVYLGNTVDIYDCVDESDHMWPVKSIPIPDNSYGHGYTVNPVSMTCGDTDGDGMDEIVLTVEYSNDYSSPEACSEANHRTYMYLLEHGDSQVLSKQLYMEVWNDYYDVTEHLETVMVSVCTTDYDFDMKEEIMVGGYMWDNGNHSKKSCEDPNYFTGELFLCSVDPNNGDTADLSLNNLKRLMDDAWDDDPPNKKYERTPYDLPATNGDYTEYRDYKDHYNADTSIMLEDWSDNNFGYCRSPNWTNWTIPMAAVSLKSVAEAPYIYLDNCLYTLRTDGGAIYSSAIPFREYQDNNNCHVSHIETASVFYREGYNYLSYEDLYRAVAMDRQEYSGGDLVWSHEVTSMDNKGNPVSSRPGSYETTPGSAYEPFMACLVDWDTSDKVLVEYAGAVSTMLEPTVLAAISGIPYDSDLADCMQVGSQNIGYTKYFSSQSSGSGSGGNFHFRIDVTGGIEVLLMEIQATSGFDFMKGWSTSTTTEITNEFTASEDSVALHLVPLDVYTYMVTRTVDGQQVHEQEDMIRMYDPLMITVPYEGYCELIDQYNASMREFYEGYGIAYTDLEKITFEHERGDIASFDEDYGDDVLESVTAAYTGNGPSGSQGSTVEFSRCTETEDMLGGNLNIRSVGKLPLKINLGAEVTVDGGEVKTHTNASGMGFQTELAAGLADAYGWEDEDAEVVTAQYGMKGTMWGVMKGINGSPYIYLGYTVETSTSACKNGWLAPNTYVIDEDEDDGDPRNPTSDSFYMNVFIPGNVRDDLVADRYEIQMYYENGWYGWRDTVEDLGLVYQVETGELDAEGRPILAELTDDFRPAIDGEGNRIDSSYWVKVSGLKDFKSSTFDFRLMGYDPDGNPHPAVRTACCTDDRVTAESLKVVDEFHLNGDNIILPWIDGLHEGALLLIETDLAPGSMVDIYYVGADGDLVYHGKETVSMDGCVLADILGGPQEKDEPVPMEVTLLVFLGILLCLAYGAHVFRQS